MTLKLRYGNFETLTRQGPLPAPACLTRPIYNKALELLAKVDLRGRGIRLVGVGSGGLVSSQETRQLSLFDDKNQARDEKIAEAIDRVSARYGSGAVKRAALLKKEGEEE